MEALNLHVPPMDRHRSFGSASSKEDLSSSRNLLDDVGSADVAFSSSAWPLALSRKVRGLPDFELVAAQGRSSGAALPALLQRLPGRSMAGPALGGGGVPIGAAAAAVLSPERGRFEGCGGMPAPVCCSCLAAVI